MESWTSRTSRLASFRVQGRLMVVKVCPRWSADAARITFDVARRLAEPEGGRGRARVVEILDWSAAPPAVVSRYVDGEELGSLLRDPLGEDPARLRTLVAAAGELLGRFHRHLPCPGGAHSSLGRRLVHCAGDFAVYNFRVEEVVDPVQGRGEVLVYMEPPAWRRAVPVHRDLAWFLWSLRLRLTGARRLYRTLHRSFLAAYLDAGDRWSLGDRVRLHFHVARRRRARRRMRKSRRAEG